MVFYTPSTSWRASTVPCSTCLNPPSTDALGGTWHDGTHIVHSIDGDDQNGGDSNGTSSSSTAAPKATSSSSSIGPGATQPIASNPPPSSAAASTPAAIPPPASSSSSAPSASPSNGDGDGDGGDDGDQDGKQKGKGGKNQRRRDLSVPVYFTKGFVSMIRSLLILLSSVSILTNGTTVRTRTIIQTRFLPLERTPTIRVLSTLRLRQRSTSLV